MDDNALYMQRLLLCSYVATHIVPEINENTYIVLTS